MTSGCLAVAGVCITGGGSGVSGGTAGMLTSWTNSTTLTATSGPTAAYYTATSTTATSTFAGDMVIGPSTSSSTDIIDNVGHHLTGGTQPTCGTGCASVVGDDNTMRVTTGSSVSSVTVNFASTWKNSAKNNITPVCVTTEESAGVAASDASSTPTTVVIELPVALTSKLISLHCRASDNFTF